MLVQGIHWQGMDASLVRSHPVGPGLIQDGKGANRYRQKLVAEAEARRQNLVSVRPRPADTGVSFSGVASERHGSPRPCPGWKARPTVVCLMRCPGGGSAEAERPWRFENLDRFRCAGAGRYSQHPAVLRVVVAWRCTKVLATAKQEVEQAV